MAFVTKLKSFVLECRRVMTVTRKPTSAEFRTIVKVTAIGMVAIGFIGFVIQMLKLIFV